MQNGIFTIVNEHLNPRVYGLVEQALNRPYDPPLFEDFERRVKSGQRLNPIQHLNEDIFGNSTAAQLEKLFNGGIYYIINGKVYSLKVFKNDVRRLRSEQH